MAYTDYRECSSCGHRATGRGFVCALKGLDPNVCPECKKPTLEKKPCPPEIEADLAKRFGDYKDGPKIQHAGDPCASCLARMHAGKLIVSKDAIDLGNGRKLNALVCDTCFTNTGMDPDDARLRDAVKKASE